MRLLMLKCYLLFSAPVNGSTFDIIIMSTPPISDESTSIPADSTADTVEVPGKTDSIPATTEEEPVPPEKPVLSVPADKEEVGKGVEPKAEGAVGGSAEPQGSEVTAKEENQGIGKFTLPIVTQIAVVQVSNQFNHAKINSHWPMVIFVIIV